MSVGEEEASLFVVCSAAAAGRTATGPLEGWTANRVAFHAADLHRSVWAWAASDTTQRIVVSPRLS